MDVAAALLTAGAFVCLFGLRLGMMRTLGAITAAGTVLHVALRH